MGASVPRGADHVARSRRGRRTFALGSRPARRAILRGAAFPRESSRFHLSLLLRRLGLELLHPLGPPPLDLVGPVRHGVQFDQPVEGLGDADGGRKWRDRLLPLLHTLVTLQEQRLGVGVLLLAQQRPAELRPCVESGPDIRLSFLADGQALVNQERFGLKVYFFCCRRLRPIWASRPASWGAVPGQRLRRASANCSLNKLASLEFSPAFIYASINGSATHRGTVCKLFGS